MGIKRFTPNENGIKSKGSRLSALPLSFLLSLCRNVKQRSAWTRGDQADIKMTKRRSAGRRQRGRPESGDAASGGEFRGLEGELLSGRQSRTKVCEVDSLSGSATAGHTDAQRRVRGAQPGADSSFCVSSAEELSGLSSSLSAIKANLWCRSTTEPERPASSLRPGTSSSRQTFSQPPSNPPDPHRSSVSDFCPRHPPPLPAELFQTHPHLCYFNFSIFSCLCSISLCLKLRISKI